MSEPQTSGGIALVRMFWMLVGPALMAVLALAIYQGGDDWLSLPSLIYWGVLGAVVFARQADPRNAEGEPTTPSNRRLHAITLLSAGTALWLIVHLFGR